MNNPETTIDKRPTIGFGQEVDMEKPRKGGILARLFRRQKEGSEQVSGDRIGAYLAAHGKPPTPENVEEIMKNPPKAIALDGGECSAYLDTYLVAAQERKLAWNATRGKWIITSDNKES